MYIPDTSCW